jgi:hypothetical protein
MSLCFIYLSRPAKLVEIMKERFVSSGGAIFEGKSLSSIYVYDDRAVSKIIFCSPGHSKTVSVD